MHPAAKPLSRRTLPSPLPGLSIRYSWAQACLRVCVCVCVNSPAQTPSLPPSAALQPPPFTPYLAAVANVWLRVIEIPP